MSKKTTSFRIDEELKASLEDEAIERRVTFSTLVHRILEDWHQQRMYIPLRLDIQEKRSRILIHPDITAKDLQKAAALRTEMNK